MQSRSAPNNRRWVRWILVACIVLLVKTYFAILWEYQYYFPADFESAFLSGRRYTFDLGYQFFFYTHIVASPIALLIATVLMILGRTKTYPKAHRFLGRLNLYLILTLVVPTGLGLAQQAYAGWIAMTAFTCHALGTGWTAIQSVRSIKQGDVDAHIRWSTRCYLLLIAPLLFRIVSGIVITLGLDDPVFYQANAWFSWIAPLVGFEAWVSIRNSRSTPIVDQVVQRETGSRPLATANTWVFGGEGMRKHESLKRRGFTLVEVLVVIAILGVLIGLLLPATRTAREAARRMSCSNNIKQVGLAMHSYHSAHKVLPIVMTGTETNDYRLSGIIALLPFMEQQSLYEQMSRLGSGAEVAYWDVIPVPWATHYEPYKQQVSTLRCPSDPGTGDVFGRTNIAFSIGGIAQEIHQPSRSHGFFAAHKQTRFRQILDGLSNTIAMGEIATDLDDRDARTVSAIASHDIFKSPTVCDDYREADRPNFFGGDVPVTSHGRGGRWADGAAAFSMINIIRPPNSASCVVDTVELADGFFNASSRHQGGAHIMMGDGAVIFMTDSVDVGDCSEAVMTPEQLDNGPAEAKYGLWGALGSAAGAEEIEEQLNQ